MSVKSGQAITRVFTTAHPATGVPTDADATPTGTLYVNGTANAATVTVTNITTGIYKAAVTLPTLTAGDSVDLRIAATVATATGAEVIWADTADTVRLSDGVTLAATQAAYAPAKAGDAMTLTAAYDAAKDDVHALLTDGTGAIALKSLVVSNASGDAVTLQSTGANGSGLYTQGNGSGPGTVSIGGATGPGGAYYGGSTSGDGLKAAALAGNSHGLFTQKWGTGSPIYGNLSGSVASVVGAVGSVAAGGLTATSVSTSAVTEVRAAIVASFSSSAAPTVAAITASVWDYGTRALTASAFLTTDYEAAKSAASQASVNAIPTTPLLAASYTAPDNAGIAAILEDTGTTIPQKIAVVNTVVDGIDTRTTSMVTNTNAIKLKTDKLPSDTSAVLSTIDGVVDDILVDTGTTLPATLSSISGKVDAVDDLVDTEVAAIKTVVDAIAVHAARIYRYFFNKRTHTNSAVVVYADNGTDIDATMVVSGDTTTVTKNAPS